MTAERTKDFDVLNADGWALGDAYARATGQDAWSVPFAEWVRDETAKAVRAEADKVLLAVMEERDEAAREALTRLAERCRTRQMPGDATENYIADWSDIEDFRDAEYPAPPAAPRSVPLVGVCAICGGEVGNGHGEWREGANDTHEHLSTFDCIKALRSQVKSLATSLAATPKET